MMNEPDSTDIADDAARAAGVATMLSGGGSAADLDDDDDAKPSRSGMAAVVLLLGGAVALGLLFWKGGPRAAIASDEVVGAQQTVTNFLASGPQNLKVMQEKLRDAEVVVQQFDQYPGQTQVPLDKLQTNPFRSLITRTITTPFDAHNASLRQQELAKQAALTAVGKLYLQTIMYAEKGSTCMINNRMLGEGDVVDGFFIDVINPGSVIVRNGTHRFQLSMRR